MMNVRSATRRHPRRGAVAVLVAVCLTVLLSVVAFGLDGGVLLDEKRHAQATADAAALAAATDLYRNYPAQNGVEGGSGPAHTAAMNIAHDNGYINDGTRSVVSVRIAPESPLTSLQQPLTKVTGELNDGYVEVNVTYNVRRAFSSLMGSGDIPVRARAVARGQYVPLKNGIHLLDRSQRASLNSTGNGTITVTGGAEVLVNSSHAEAAVGTGGGALIAPVFNINGGVNDPSQFSGTINTGVPPAPDPLAYLPAPAVPADGTITWTPIGMGNRQYTLTPGRYTNLPLFNTGDVVIMQQASAGAGGIYYIDGGGFKSTGANITMDPATTGGLMIYNKPDGPGEAQKIDITGNELGTVNLSGLTSGLYDGMLFWQDRAADLAVSVTGNGAFTLNGTFYAANSPVKITGNGDAIIGSQYISRTLDIGGNGNLTVNYSGAAAVKTRILSLVK